MDNPADVLRIGRIRDWMMDLLDEALIERYVRFQDTMTARETQRAESLMQTSSAARRLADFFREYYEELDAAALHLDHPEGTAQSEDLS